MPLSSHGTGLCFPQPPNSLLEKIERAFAKEKPLFALAPYHPLDYPLGEAQDKGDFEIGRQRGLVGLIRVQFLKRFESSIAAFEQSCQNLLLKFLAFLAVNRKSKREQERLEKWRIRNADLLAHIHARRQELVEDDASEETEETLGDEFLDHFEPLDRQLYRLDDILDDTFDDLDTLVKFIEKLKHLTPSQAEERVTTELQQQDPTVLSRKKKTLTWWCVFELVEVRERIWCRPTQSYLRPLPKRLGVTPRGAVSPTGTGADGLWLRTFLCSRDAKCPGALWL